MPEDEFFPEQFNPFDNFQVASVPTLDYMRFHRFLQSELSFAFFRLIQEQGGSFARAFGDALSRADPVHKHSLICACPWLIEEYMHKTIARHTS